MWASMLGFPSASHSSPTGTSLSVPLHFAARQISIIRTVPGKKKIGTATLSSSTWPLISSRNNPSSSQHSVGWNYALSPLPPGWVGGQEEVCVWMEKKGIKLHLEVKCPRRQCLERLLRSDLDGRVSNRERGGEMRMMLADGQGNGRCGWRR